VPGFGSQLALLFGRQRRISFPFPLLPYMYECMYVYGGAAVFGKVLSPIRVAPIFVCCLSLLLGVVIVAGKMNGLPFGYYTIRACCFSFFFLPFFSTFPELLGLFLR